MLYKTGVEYGDYTMNHVQGCSHGCLYPCYAFMMKKRFGQVKTYDDWIEPKLVANTLDLLDKELPRMKSKIRSVQLSFSTDPFMRNYPEVGEMSLQAIKKINSFQIPCTILTKGILPIELAELSKENEYGITLISLNQDYLNKVEPFAAPVSERLAALKNLHDLGCRTWVSIEPYPTPNLIEQDLYDVLQSVDFVDRIVFGRLNYSKSASSYKNNKDFYNDCSSIVRSFCEEHGIDCWIKEGTEIDVKTSQI